MTDLKEDYVDKETGLTEKEQYFLDVLFDVHKGNVRLAMEDAGYPKNTPTRAVTHKLKDRILELSKTHLAISTGKAVGELVDILYDPNKPGAKNIISAAKEVLDRTGIKQKEEATPTERNVIILPPKASQIKIEVEDDE